MRGVREGQPRSRFAPKLAGEKPKRIMSLNVNHLAMTDMRTLFRRSVQAAPVPGTSVLKSGMNQRKLGDRVSKGAWKGCAIYSLTLEERATCPSSCHALSTCYGNGMPRSKRYPKGPALETAVAHNLQTLSDRHPRGFVVRLHILGDFYSLEYVAFWRAQLEGHGALRVFGYTAWPSGHKIQRAIENLNRDFAGRCAIRFSRTTAGPMAAIIVPNKMKGPLGIVCPAQTHADTNCGSCGLCWSPAMKNKTIAFIQHGNHQPGRPPLRIIRPDDEIPLPPKVASLRPPLVIEPRPPLPAPPASMMGLISDEGYQRWIDQTRAELAQVRKRMAALELLLAAYGEKP